MTKKVTVVFAHHWSMDLSEYGFWEPVYNVPEIRKIFDDLEKAIAYINSVPNQKAPSYRQDTAAEDWVDCGFYLTQQQYEVE